MIRTFYIFVFSILFIISCAPIKVACVGDSITYGAGIKNKDSLSYPKQLQNLLGQNYEVDNFGVSGATMLKNGNKPYWEQPEFEKAKLFKPKIVVLMLGTNDSKTQNWNSYKDEYISDYNSMIQTFKKINPKVTLYIGLPPPVIENRWNIQKNIVEFEILNMLNTMASENHIKTIDFFTLFQGKSNLIPDQVHPNAEGAKLMAAEAFKIIKLKH